jgi:mRNA interferase HigB
MRVFAIDILESFWRRRPESFQPLQAWYTATREADWRTPMDVLARYGNASIIGGKRIVFRIAGNRYRVVIELDYARRIAVILFVGTHSEYDRIDARRI